MKKLERGCVGPLQILEQNQKWRLSREPPEELREVPKQPGFYLRWIRAARRPWNVGAGCKVREEISELGSATAGEYRERRRIELAQKREQCIGKQSVGHAGLDRVCSSDRDCPPAPRRSLCRRGRQPGFPDTTLSDDEYGASRALRS